MVYLAHDFSSSCDDGILVGLESVPSDEAAKTLAGLTEMTLVQKRNSTITN